jgi:aspartyl-tRNA(Asn)/glutamyl-tRNA(Gln) amidotransferase subunit C
MSDSQSGSRSRITFDEVRELALLARLRLSDDEVARMAGDLDAILDYVAALGDLDTAKVEPMTHAVPFDCPLRPDDARPSLSLEEALANAPRREASFFQVPRIVPGPAGSGGGGEDDGL